MSGDSCTHLSTEDLREALFSAIEEKHEECVKILLQKGAGVYRRDNKRDTPLAKAAHVGNVDIVKNLIAAGADVNIPGYYHLPPLSRAADNNNVQCIKILIEAGADVNFSYRSRRYTPLMSAVAKGHLESAEILIASGADVNLIAGEGVCAIILAAREVQSESINLLVKAGADVNMVGDYGYTAMIWAAARPCTQAVDCIKNLLCAGAFINVFCRIGRNALLNSMCNDYKTWSNDDVGMLLFAAGEILEGEIDGNEVNTSHLQIPEFLQHFKNLKFCLKHLCREAIRKHLINLAPHTHLFGRIPLLGLPTVLSKYVLYYVSLDE